jgi:hypothetical protein
MPPPNRSDIILALLLEDRFSEEMDKTISHFEERLKRAESLKEIESIERQFQDVKQVVDDTTASLNAQSSVLRAHAALLANQVTQLRARSAEAARIASSLAQQSGLSLATGTGIVGGIFAEANRFAKEAEDAGKATQATREWTQATKELAAARERVDRVLVREALPLLQDVARLATQASEFVESHPELVQAGLNTGKILIALGAVGIIASRGIKLYADVLYLQSVPIQLQAARLQAQAAQQQLIAARLKADQLGVGATPPGGRAGAPGLMSTITMVVAGLAASAAVVTLVDQILERSRFAQEREDAIERARDQGARIYPGILPPAERELQNQLNRAQIAGNAEEVARLRGEIDKLGEAAEETGEVVGRALTRLAGHENEEAIVSAFTQWQEEDRRLIEEAAADRVRILADAERRIAEETRRYAQQRVEITRQFDETRAQIIRDFGERSRDAEIQYAEARADIIRDAGEEVRQIEEQHQENIRRMTLEHNQRVADLTASRDALGLVKEQRRFDQERAEAERETNQEIAQRRRNIAIRLQDLANEFASERAQRQAQFEQSLADNEARRQEELKALAAAHAEELRQIREQRAAQLRELQESLNAERLRRREVFLAEIRDLDAALLGERNLKLQRYAQMLADADKFLADWRNKVAAGLTGGSVPVRDQGGYVGPGIFRVERGREFVMDPQTTRAAERMIGGQLNQQSLMRALVSGRGQVTLHYQPRIDGRISVADRRALLQDTLQAIRQELV